MAPRRRPTRRNRVRRRRDADEIAAVHPRSPETRNNQNLVRATGANDPARPAHKRRPLIDSTCAIDPLYEKCGLRGRPSIRSAGVSANVSGSRRRRPPRACRSAHARQSCYAPSRQVNSTDQRCASTSVIAMGVTGSQWSFPDRRATCVRPNRCREMNGYVCRASAIARRTTQ